MIKTFTDYSLVKIKDILEAGDFDNLSLKVKELSNGNYSLIEARKWCFKHGFAPSVNKMEFLTNYVLWA